MIIYLVWQGEYSDAGVSAIFSNKDVAEKYMSELTKTNHYDSTHIEEMELDDPSLNDVVAKPYWLAQINISTGEIFYRSQGYTFDLSSSQDFGNKMWDTQTVYSDISQEHAEKLAIERRQRILREYKREESTYGSGHYQSTIVQWVK